MTSQAIALTVGVKAGATVVLKKACKVFHGGQCFVEFI